MVACSCNAHSFWCYFSKNNITATTKFLCSKLKYSMEVVENRSHLTKSLPPKIINNLWWSEFSWKIFSIMMVFSAVSAKKDESFKMYYCHCLVVIMVSFFQIDVIYWHYLLPLSKAPMTTWEIQEERQWRENENSQALIKVNIKTHFVELTFKLQLFFKGLHMKTKWIPNASIRSHHSRMVNEPVSLEFVS